MEGTSGSGRSGSGTRSGVTSDSAAGSLLPWAELHQWRVGCVRYLNSKPLIHDYGSDLLLAHPSELARELAADRLDAALVPVFEVLRNPRYTLVDDVAIASDGPVYSVFLALRKPVKEVRTVALDPASRTSAHLLQVLLAEYHGVRVQCGAAADFSTPADAELLIGNQAIEARDAGLGDVELMDLGAEWKRCTGLPFVYAAWALRPGVSPIARVAEAFRRLKEHGLARREEIVAADPTSTVEFRRQYLFEYIRFGLGEGEKAGLRKYRELLEKHGLIEQNTSPLVFA